MSFFISFTGTPSISSGINEDKNENLEVPLEDLVLGVKASLRFLSFLFSFVSLFFFDNFLKIVILKKILLFSIFILKC